MSTVFTTRGRSGYRLVCQHTAGSDGRQYRHIYRGQRNNQIPCHCGGFTLHGKSLPPDSKRYWEERYQLHKDWFINFGFLSSSRLERPIYMGCSMGGILLATGVSQLSSFYRP